jgi:hypothetical protein
MSLKNKLTEEDFAELDAFYLLNFYVSDHSYENRVKAAKERNWFVKSPLEQRREETDKYINEILEPHLTTTNNLIKFIQSERQEADKKGE